MSLVFDSSDDLARIAIPDPWAAPIGHNALTFTWKFKATAAAAGVLFAWKKVTSQHHRIKLASNGTSITIEHNNGTGGTSTALTGAVGSMISIGVRTDGTNASGTGIQTTTLFVKVGSAATQKVVLADDQGFDYISEFWFGPSEKGTGPTGEQCDLKMWLASLTDAEIEEEFAQQTPKRSLNLLCYNDFAGANIDAALTSDSFSLAWAETWGQVDSSGAAGTKPTLGSATASYASLPTLSGNFALPSTAPVSTTAAAVVQTAGVSTLGTTPTALTLSKLPGINTLLVVPMGGWLANATDGVGATIADNQPDGGLVWTKRMIKQRTPGAQDAWVMAWTAVVTRSRAPFTITVAPSGATANGYFSVSAHEVVRANLAAPLDVKNENSGSGTSGTVDLPTTTNAKDLIFAVASWLNSEGSASLPSGSPLSQLFAKQGQAGLHVSARYVTSTSGAYDPTWTFEQQGGGNVQWVAGALAIKEQAATTTPAITTTTLPAAVVGTPYEKQIEASGTGPLTFAKTSGSLPSWATLSENGLITGTPVAGAAATFGVKATGPGGTSVEQSLTLGSGTQPVVTTSTLGTLVVGQNISIVLAATGSGTMTWEVSSGSLPAGTALQGNTIIGKPSSAGSGSVYVTATGDGGTSVPKQITWTVVAAAAVPAITTLTLGPATVGTPFSATMTATGTGPITWSAGAGVPSGLTMDSSGVWSGTPTLAGGFFFDVTATNAYDSHTVRYGITVQPAATTAQRSPWNQWLKAR